jgi:hypothetical protein
VIGRTPATPEEIEAHEDKIDEYYQKDAQVKQQIITTTTDRILLSVSLATSADMWKEVCKLHEGRSELVQMDVRRRLAETRCEDSADLRMHFAELRRLREMLAGMGASISEPDFTAIIMGSLPESYRSVLSSLTAAAQMSAKALTSPD